MPDRDGGEDRLFDRLRMLKRDGVSVLVTGGVPDRVLDKASAQFLGTVEGSPDRDRLFYLIDRDVGGILNRLYYRNVPASDVAVVDDRGGTQRLASATIVDGPGGQPASDTLADRVHEPDVSPSTITDELERALTTCLEQRSTRCFAPAQLRVCVDSLRPLVDARGPDAAQAVLDDVGAVVSDTHDGMVQFVLPVPHEHDLVDDLTGYDILCRLDVHGTTPVQQWYLPTNDVVSDWHELVL